MTNNEISGTFILVDKLTKQANFKFTDLQHRALHELSRLHGLTTGELIRSYVERDWAEHAEDLKKIDETIAKARKKRAA